MITKSLIKRLAFSVFFVGLAAGLSAQVTLSAGVALATPSIEVGSASEDGNMGAGFNVYADYLLPIGVPMSLGFEFGYDTGSFTIEGTDYGVYAMPFLLRAAYHFDLMPELDLYAVGKIGYVLGGDGTESGVNGLGFGIDIGAAYYITPNFGFFGELGYDSYSGSKSYSANGRDITEDLNFWRLFTFGISVKY